MVLETKRLEFLTKNADYEELHKWILQLSASMKQQQAQQEQFTDDEREELSYLCERQAEKISLQYDRHGRLDSYERWRPLELHVALMTVVRAAILLQERLVLRKALTVNPHCLTPELWKEIGSMLDPTRFEIAREGYVSSYDFVAL